jgi:hypothetical protein
MRQKSPVTTSSRSESEGYAERSHHLLLVVGSLLAAFYSYTTQQTSRRSSVVSPSRSPAN